MIRKSLKKVPEVFPNSLKKVMTYGGGIAVLFAVVASIYSLFHLSRFITNGFDVLSYAQYLIIIIGGAAIGFAYAYFSSVKNSKVFTAISFSLIAFILFLLLDSLRVAASNSFSELEYPYSMYMYSLLPFLALLLLILLTIAASLVKNKKWLYRWGPWGVAVVFVVQQLMTIVMNGVINMAEYQDVVLPILFLTILSMPISIAILSYVVLRRVKRRGVRAFCAAYVGLVFFLVTQSSWSFITEPGYEYTSIVASVAYFAALSFSLVLVVFMHRSLAHTVK